MKKDRILDGWGKNIQWSNLSLLEAKDLCITTEQQLKLQQGWVGLGDPQQPRQYLK